jgi:thiopurine S-methyltransferase
MHHEFWHERWRSQQIGFHLTQVNPTLVRHRAVLGPAGRTRALVPLCGKSLDLAYLRTEGFEVIGVELSELAARAFFEETQRPMQVDTHGPFQRFRSDGITLLCGDYFALTPALLGRVDALYDRAALIALPQDMRGTYAAHTAQLLTPGARGLLIGFDYEPPTGGPPFSVSEREVRALYSEQFEVELLERNSILEQEPRFRERGITALHESAYRLQRR